MKRGLTALLAFSVAAAAAWWAYGYSRDWRYAHQPLEVEEVEAPTFSIEIPKGWERPDYSDPREDASEFTTSASTATSDEGDPYFVQGRLSITDYGEKDTVDSVMADWRKDEKRQGRISPARLGKTEAKTWTTSLPFFEIVGEARTFVFRGTNGHVYSGYYQLSRPGPFRMRQDYVFARILASMKFRDDSMPGGAAR